jgi:hypothetical protein
MLFVLDNHNQFKKFQYVYICTIFCFKLFIYIIDFESYASYVIDYVYKNYLNLDFAEVYD